MSIINLKEKIRKDIIRKCAFKEGSVFLVMHDTFEKYLFDLIDESEDKYNRYMASLVADAYEILKWREIAGRLSVPEKTILFQLDNADTVDEAIDAAILSNAVNYFFYNLYLYEQSLLSTKINTRNFINNSDVNDVIIKADVLRIAGELDFYSRGYILSKEYSRDDYLSLYDSLKKDLLNNNITMLCYTDVVMGLEHYNEESHKKLILDMYLELFFQNYYMGKNYKANITQDYLLYLIKDQEVSPERMLLIARDPICLDNLASNFINYRYYEEDWRQKMMNDNDAVIHSCVKKITQAQANKKGSY